MLLLAEIAEWSIVAFGSLILVVQLLAHETSYRLGRRLGRRDTGQAESVAVVVGGMLALAAFVLALTLSFAMNRFSERRAGTLAEANAIGTAWLQAQAIGHPRGLRIAELLEDYTRVRMDYVQSDPNPARIEGLTRQTNALQGQIWGHLTALVREQPSPISSSLMASLNQTFDMSTAERFAFDRRMPPQVVWLLLGITVLGTAALGYQLGIRGRAVRVPVALFIAMWSVVIVNILDLATARLGTIQTGTSVYQWTLQGFTGGITIPPLPTR